MGSKQKRKAPPRAKAAKKRKIVNTRRTVLQEKNINSAPAPKPKCDLKNAQISLVPLNVSMVAVANLKIPKVHLEQLAPCPPKIEVQKMSRASFASLFELKEVDQANSSLNCKGKPEMTQTSFRQKYNFRRASQITSLFRNNPLPITSKKGQDVVHKSGFGLCQNPEKFVLKNDKLCSTKGRIKGPNIKCPIITKNTKIIPDGIYSHKYLFTRRQKQQRRSELIIGLPKKSWDNYNKVNLKSFVKLDTLSSEEISRMIKGGLSDKETKKLMFHKRMNRVLKRMDNNQVDLVVPGTSSDLKMENWIKKVKNVKVLVHKLRARQIRKHLKKRR